MSVETDDQGGAGAAESSLRDDLASALTEARERDETSLAEAGAPAGDAADAAATDTGDAGKAPRADGRDEAGKFAKKPKADDQAAPDAQAQAPAADAAAAPAAADAEAAPKSWRHDEAAEWASMTPMARAAVQRREKEIAGIIGRQDNERLFGKEMAEIIRPYAEEISAAGATPQAALQTLFKNHNSLRSANPEERVSTARRLLWEYGIDPSMVAQPDPSLPQDPHIQALMRQVQGLTHQLTARQGGQQHAPLPDIAGDDNIQSDIDGFRTDPAHPHFDHVAGHMAGLIESGAAPDLETAYQMAVAANPALRSTAPAPTARETQRSNEVTAARQASVSVSGSPGVAGTPKPANLRDELRQELRRHGVS